MKMYIIKCESGYLYQINTLNMIGEYKSKMLPVYCKYKKYAMVFSKKYLVKTLAKFLNGQIEEITGKEEESNGKTTHH